MDGLGDGVEAKDGMKGRMCDPHKQCQRTRGRKQTQAHANGERDGHGWVPISIASKQVNNAAIATGRQGMDAMRVKRRNERVQVDREA